MDGFVTLTDMSYMRGAQALVHTIRRWYPETPICIGCVAFNNKKKARIEEFAERHGNVKLIHLELPGFRTHPWFYKARAILNSGFENCIFMDADCLLTFAIPEAWESIKAGFLWGGRGKSKPPHMFHKLMDDKMWTYLYKNPAHLFHTGLCGFKISKWRDLLQEWDDLCFTKDLRGKTYGDMGLFNYMLFKHELLHETDFVSEARKYGTICELRSLLKYDKGLATVHTPDCKGVIKIVHYNGLKPWILLDKERKGRIKDKPRLRRQFQSDSMKLWLEVHASIKKGNKAWEPII